MHIFYAHDILGYFCILKGAYHSLPFFITRYYGFPILTTRRPDAGILAEPSLRRLTCHFNNNLLVFCKVRPSNCKRNKQNWHECNVRCMVDVKIPSRIGANRRVLALKRDILTLSHNTIDIALVRTDGGRVWVVAGGHVVTIL